MRTNRLSYSILLLGLVAIQSVNAAPLCRLVLHNSQASSYSNEITVVVGTDRPGSNSSVVANEILKTLAADPNIRINLVDLAKLPKSIFKSDYFATKPAGFVNDFVNPIERAQALIFVVPEYDGAIPGILSYYMNHMRVGLDNKMVSLVGISSGKWGARAALDAFKGTLTHRKAQVMGALQVNIENIDGKVTDGRVSDTDSINRLAHSARELNKNVNRLPGSLSGQKNIAIMARGLRGRATQLTLNSGVKIEGRLNQYLTNSNQTLSFVQLNGSAGIPVGPVKDMAPGWFKKSDVVSSRFKQGHNVQLQYESGVTVSGQVKSLNIDSHGQLTSVTLRQARVQLGDRQLIDTNLNEYDLFVADYIESLSPAE